MKLHNFAGASLVVASLLAIATPMLGKGHGVQLPAAAEKTFKATFPKAKIDKVDVDEENGVTVYDVEFRDGAIEMETDIAADGTMLEVTVVVDAKAVPAGAMKTIDKAATGATILRIERIELSHETKDGKVIKLPVPLTRYAAAMARGDDRAEIVVDSEGNVVEPAKWDTKEENKSL